MLTERDKQLLRAQLMAQGAGPNIPPGMVNQSVVTPEVAASAARDFSAEQARLAAQQKIAQELMAGAYDTQPGVQAGNVYTAGASPMGGLANALRGFTGGYMASRANAGYGDLQKAQDDRSQATGVIAAIEDARAAKQDAAALRNIQNQITTRNRNATVSEGDLALAQQAAADERIQNQVAVENPTKAYIGMDLASPDASPRRVQEFADGRREYDNGDPVPDTVMDYNDWADQQAESAKIAARTGADDYEGITRQSEKTNLDLQKYAKELERTSLPRLETDLARVDELLAKLPRNEQGGIENIPGVGGFANLQGTPGKLFALGEKNLTKKGPVDPVDMRNTIQRLLNTEIRNQSGAAVTLHEMVRNTMGSSVDWSSSDENFLAMWPHVKQVIANIRANVDSGYGPEVVDIYNRRQQGESLTTREYFEQAAEGASGRTKDPADMTLEELEAELGI